MTIAAKTADLTKVINETVKELEVTQASLDAQVSTAEGYATTAATHQATAEGYRDTAATHAAEAATHLATVQTNVTYQGISAILDSKAVTAVDVFVYDTSLDSDGGAWRKRCQHTSWYNEPLNTATRGARREFPAVAVIVAETGKVTIYDGDDPALPLWAVLDINTTFIKVFAVNGLVGMASEAAGIVYWSFIDENLIRYIVSGKQSQPWSRDVVGANFVTIDATASIVNSRTTDIAMTVLPDAPVDPATGLPVPTIAVATDGGVSVIKDDGTVVDSASTTICRKAQFADESLVYSPSSAPHNLFIVDNVGSLADGFTQTFYLRREDTSVGDYPRGPQAATDGTRHAYLGDNTFATSNTVSKSLGVFLWNRGEGVSVSKNKGLMAKVQSNYNTGWMPGDIKGAFLSDTDTSDLVRSGELVTNGTFDTDLSDWTLLNGATDNSVSGIADITSGPTSNICLRQTLTGLVIGATYLVSFTRVTGTGNSAVYAGPSNTNSGFTSVAGDYSFNFVATATSHDVTFRAGAANSNLKMDNISVKRADADRSVNNSGLIVHGTVTRVPVATGADLVGYSGTTNINYLSKDFAAEYNGQSSFALIFWVNAAAGQGIFNWYETVGGGGTSSAHLQCYVDGSADSIRYVWQNRQSLNTSSDGAAAVGRWVQQVMIFDGGDFKVYEDGVLVTDASTAISADLHELRLQMSGSTKLALFRITETIPTAEQIRKIYEDERKLFQPGAQCTLYGTSDAVTALSHDPKTNLLHVGTSQGRSVFDGLQRVANTETPVGTAISAVNGLIVEE